MGLTAENVAERWDVSREDMDAFAQRSQERAVAAQSSGFAERELTPYTKEDGTVVAADDGPRPTSTLEKLAALEPAFVPGGKVTAGQRVSAERRRGGGARPVRRAGRESSG